METAVNYSVNEIFGDSPIATLNVAIICAIVQNNIYANNKVWIYHNGAPGANRDAAYLVRVKEKKMEVDWACQPKATDIHPKIVHTLNPSEK